ncbi:MAG: hypothetical protein LHW60_00080 [Candidatus Cloacimonetes bacterium]|nr:hypothetical protein [Candidatus Cloacimonadota bacterium]
MNRQFLLCLIIVSVLLAFGCAEKNTAYVDKSAVKKLAQVSVVGNPSQIDTGDNYAFVALDQGGLAQINLSNFKLNWYPEMSAEDGSMIKFWRNRRLAYIEETDCLFLYEVQTTDKFHVISTADPDTLKVVDAITGGTASVQDIYARALDEPLDHNTMEIVFCSQSMNLNYALYDGVLYPGSIYGNNTHLFLSGVYVEGDYIYAAAQQNGLAIFNKTDGALISNVVTGGEAQKLVVKDGYAYIAARQSGLKIVDVRDVNNPVLVGSYDTTGHATFVDYSRGHVALSSGGGGAYLLDVSNPAAPKLKERITECGYVNSVKMSGDILIVGSRDEGVFFYEF